MRNELSAPQVDNRVPAQRRNGYRERTEEVDGKHAERLRGSVLGMVYLLPIQFALGMVVNLFVTISPSPNGFWWPVVTGPSAILIAHIVLGTFIVINSVVIGVHSLRVSDMAPRVLSSLGSLAVLAAWISGRVFLGTNANAASFAMALGFAVAIAAYGQLLYSLRRTA